MFKKKKIALGVALGFLGLTGIITSAQAVSINADGKGQVLLFPYYNARDGYVTNINLVNSTDETKAVRIRFREGKNSQDVLDFNLYMSPEDVWTGSIGSSDAKGPGEVTTQDMTCALPELASCKTGKCSVTVPMKSKGTNNAPTLGNDPEDTLEGYVEVIEMGVVTDSTVQYGVLHNKGKPNNCGVVADAWYRGVFKTGHGSAATGLSAPTGGLIGSAAVLNVNEGTAMAIDPIAIENFTTRPHHTRPDDSANFNLPSLASGSVRTSEVLVKRDDGTMDLVQTEWFERPEDPCLERGEPACGKNPFPVAHALLASRVMNEYFLDPTDGFDGHSDWIVTFPMKKYGVFHDEDKLVFEESVDSSGRRVCTLNGVDYASNYLAPQCEYTGPVHVTFGEEIFDREEGRKKDEQFSPYQGYPRILEREVNVLTFFTSDPAYDSSRTVMSHALGSDKIDLHDIVETGGFVSGWARMSFMPWYSLDQWVAGPRSTTVDNGKGGTMQIYSGVAYDYGKDGEERLYPSSDNIYKGVPVIGFAALEGNVSENPNARFGDALPHRYNRAQPIDNVR